MLGTGVLDSDLSPGILNPAPALRFGASHAPMCIPLELLGVPDLPVVLTLFVGGIWGERSGIWNPRLATFRSGAFGVPASVDSFLQPPEPDALLRLLPDVSVGVLSVWVSSDSVDSSCRSSKGLLGTDVMEDERANL